MSWGHPSWQVCIDQSSLDSVPEDDSADQSKGIFFTAKSLLFRNFNTGSDHGEHALGHLNGILKFLSTSSNSLGTLEVLMQRTIENVRCKVAKSTDFRNELDKVSLHLNNGTLDYFAKKLDNNNNRNHSLNPAVRPATTLLADFSDKFKEYTEFSKMLLEAFEIHTLPCLQEYMEFNDTTEVMH